jgi:CheY-like chemotaxis protein
MVQHQIQRSDRKILIVDDEVNVLEPMEILIRKLGYQAESAPSGREAIEKCRVWEPHAVLIDRHMPKMDGITCARRILDQWPSTLIILMSGEGEEDHEELEPEIRRLVSAFVPKPINISGLRQTLFRLLGEP